MAWAEPAQLAKFEDRGSRGVDQKRRRAVAAREPRLRIVRVGGTAGVAGGCRQEPRHTGATINRTQEQRSSTGQESDHGGIPHNIP
jgi:hypothetical protein